MLRDRYSGEPLQYVITGVLQVVMTGRPSSLAVWRVYPKIPPTFKCVADPFQTLDEPDGFHFLAVVQSGIAVTPMLAGHGRIPTLATTIWRSESM
jgi:hypothetical protein